MPDYFDKGFVVREQAWHGKATLLGDWPGSVDEAWEAGFGWEPAERLLSFTDKDGEQRIVDGRKALVRDDDESFLADVGDGFTPVSNRTLLEILDVVLSETGVRFDSVGSADGGRKVWAVAYLDEGTVLPGDITPTHPFLSMQNAHDGSSSLALLHGSIREVCANTWIANRNSASREGRIFSFRHTSRINERIDEAKAAVLCTRTSFADYLAMCGWLADRQVDAGTVEDFLDEFIPVPPAGLTTERVQANVQRSRETFRDNLFTSPTLDGVPMTGYRLFQAATEYADHLRGYRNADSYVGRTLLRPEPLKEKAVAIIRRVTR